MSLIYWIKNVKLLITLLNWEIVGILNITHFGVSLSNICLRVKILNNHLFDNLKQFQTYS